MIPRRKVSDYAIFVIYMISSPRSMIYMYIPIYSRGLINHIKPPRAHDLPFPREPPNPHCRASLASSLPCHGELLRPLHRSRYRPALLRARTRIRILPRPRGV